MAFFDWNHNGKKDGGDRYIEYHIYKDMTGDGDSEHQYETSTSSGGHAEIFIIVCIIALIFIGIVRI